MGKVDPVSEPEPISVTHDFNVFDCGNAALNDWLRSRAARSEGLSSRCYVVCAGRIVVGYYSLSTGAERHNGAGRAPRALRANMPDPTPVMILGRLAVDKMYQGRSIGRDMLRDALLRVLTASRIVGARALIVHAIDDDVVPFYARFGFKPFPDDGRTMFLPMETIRKLL
jgi:GNAT superfamily N-acetyltransferase